jgi:hypothetical protein
MRTGAIEHLNQRVGKSQAARRIGLSLEGVLTVV